ncbi:MAG: T9SS type A sorting domain-containing protein [Bacteroidia bacterium]
MISFLPKISKSFSSAYLIFGILILAFACSSTNSNAQNSSVHRGGCTVTINQVDTTVCNGTQLVLSVSGSFVSYTWSTTETTSSIQVSPSALTVYTVTVDDGVSTCTDAVQISVSPTYDYQVQASVCQGDGYTLPNGQVETSAGTYPVTLVSSLGCDSTITTVLSLRPTYSITRNESICQGATFTLPDGSIVSTSGSYPVTLQSIGNCDSTITTNLVVNPVYSSNVNASICQGATYSLPNGQSVSTAGTYPVTLNTMNNCDSLITTVLTVKPTYSSTVNASICQGQSYLLPNNVSVNTSGTYPVTLQTVGNCDSIITTVLTVNPTYSISRNASICIGQSYTLPGGTVVSSAGVYPITLHTTSGCDSVITTTLIVYPVYNVTRTASICQGASFTLPNGQSVSTSGVYAVTLSSIHGCDSVVSTTLTVNPTYSISRNAVICQGATFVLPNGQSVSTSGTYPVTLQTLQNCDSVITTTLVVKPSYSIVRNEAICQGESFVLPNGQIVSTAGSYPVVLFTTFGCDSVITTNLSINAAYYITRNASICQGSSYTLPGGTVVTSPGSYPVSFQTFHGCDSVITTNLSVNPVFTVTNNVSICQGSSYTLPNNQVVSTAGSYPVLLHTTQGCDSLVTTVLTVGSSIINTIPASICQGESYVLPNGQTVTQSGNYPITYQTPSGCDSTVLTVLSVYPNYSQSQNGFICQGEVFTLPDGQDVNATGTYVVTLAAQGGCDSVVTTNLTVYPTFRSNTTETICQGKTVILPDGQEVSTPGTYVTSFQTINGCDSSYSLVLTVTPPPTFSFNVDLCQGETYLLPDGTPVTVSGTYISTLSDVNGCDSLIFTFATFHGFTAPDITGSTAVNAFHTTGYSVNDVPGHVYTWTVTGGNIVFGNGTDSIAVAWQGMGTGIIVVNESDSQCDYTDTLYVNIGPVGVPDYLSDYSIRLFPNPVNGRCQLSWNGAGAVQSLLIHDITGKIIYSVENFTGENVELNLENCAPGIYFIELTGAQLKTQIPFIRQ